LGASEEPQRTITMEGDDGKKPTRCAVTLLRILLSAPLLIALSAPLAAPTHAQKTDQRLQQADKAVDAVTEGAGAALGGIPRGVMGGPVGLALEGKGGYHLAEAGEAEKEQQRHLQEAEQQFSTKEGTPANETGVDSRRHRDCL